MRMLAIATAACVLAATPARAQSADSKFYTTALLQQYQYVQGLIMKTAEKVGEDVYSFKPTPEVRSLAGVLGHVADGNMLLCGGADGKTPDFEKIMKDPTSVQVHAKKTSKAELMAALKETSAYCESVFNKLTDETAKEMVPWFGGAKMPKLMMLNLAVGHGWEHYGNLVTYMRLKNIVPPSSSTN
jgi:uncharacterized damage-inducible protein DinB